MQRSDLNGVLCHLIAGLHCRLLHYNSLDVDPEFDWNVVGPNSRSVSITGTYLLPDTLSQVEYDVAVENLGWTTSTATR